MEKGDLMPTNWNEIAYRMSDVLVRVNTTAKTQRIIITTVVEIKCSTLAGTGNGKSNSSFLPNALCNMHIEMMKLHDIIIQLKRCDGHALQPYPPTCIDIHT